MDRDGRPGWLPSLGFAFLSFNCGMAVYRSWDDPYAVAFVLAAYAALVLLFRCLHLLERRRDQRLKLAVWGLSTLLTLMFSYKIAAVMPPWAQLLVWGMGILTVVAGFYAFFVARPEEP
ncbi:hypothetical protein Zm00014a_026878 [Zea mays]|jgi:peptidoglycan biosynthesis protein MviN/MurJ (putative lipid II flippase)|uniref:Uncharacterized protein n=2 Tax=Zea mays TaxID=4577 RepID=B6TGI4_MAIZE|nr:uncharacterized protein LOC100276687 [Zea mays]XP_020397590.1 uncharacterized protein LOC100276687 isoform X1 [Zea mays]ACG36217.1 hypothetical protein [Zea mays]AQK91217.1 hypothetical protein ZEAMMB73_Zm00001d009024 [Zea mays]PWZ08951.1 hypothetical protein Zm00014a_026878 [Zea mays]|eukprot:NP_001143886.1 uncharacterized protein LOC100276687 [Zea mays]